MCTKGFLKEKKKSRTQKLNSPTKYNLPSKGTRKAAGNPNQINRLINIKVFVVYTGKQKDLLKACNGSNHVTILTTFNT